jgi:hypothetical protein
MTRLPRLVPLVLLAALSLAVALPAVAARDKGRKMDLVYLAPDFAAYGAASIALLPVVTYDGSASTEGQVSTYWGQLFRATGYRWISANTTREMLRTAVGDSVVKLMRDEVLKDGRVDSLRASVLCARLRVDAVLSLRVDQWEQVHVLWNQSGKPTTSIGLRAALVDSSGRLLWSASGSETGEGPYHDPSLNPISVSGSSLENTPVTGQGGPPVFQEVLSRLLNRWVPQFPRTAAADTLAK